MILHSLGTYCKIDYQLAIAIVKMQYTIMKGMISIFLTCIVNWTVVVDLEGNNDKLLLVGIVYCLHVWFS